MSGANARWMTHSLSARVGVAVTASTRPLPQEFSETKGDSSAALASAFAPAAITGEKSCRDTGRRGASSWRATL